MPSPCLRPPLPSPFLKLPRASTGRLRSRVCRPFTSSWPQKERPTSSPPRACRRRATRHSRLLGGHSVPLAADSDEDEEEGEGASRPGDGYFSDHKTQENVVFALAEDGGVCMVCKMRVLSGLHVASSRKLLKSSTASCGFCRHKPLYA